jgi:two-component system cell cycle response regulator
MANATDIPEKRVLIVDDSKFVRTTFNRILSPSFAVREEADGEAAWQALQSDASIVMVFSDLDMPKLDGYGLLRRIRAAKDERVRKLPVIVISGSQDQAAKSRASQAGASDFITKSAEADEVLSRIDKLLQLIKPDHGRAPSAPAAQQIAAQAAQKTGSQPIVPPPAQRTGSQPIVPQPPATQTGTHDVLTGAFTSQSLLAEGRKHYSYAQRHGGQLSVMVFRVESHAQAARDAGKEVADQVLARIAMLIKGMLRAEESFGRIAEATFMVISAGSGASQVLAFARRLHAQLEAAQVKHGAQVLKIRSSFGLASMGNATGGSIEDLMKLALQRVQAAARRPTDPIVGENERAAAAPSALNADIERALQVLEGADPKQLGDASEATLRGLLDKVVKILAGKEIEKVSSSTTPGASY